MHPPMEARAYRGSTGFTLLELTVAVTLILVVAAIAVPQYVSSLRRARMDRARGELLMIAAGVDKFRVTNGELPVTLLQVGFGGRSDPWGVPYCFFNYEYGTGDGLEWGLSAGLIDPEAIVGSEASGSVEAVPESGSGGGPGGGRGHGHGAGGRPRRLGAIDSRPQNPAAAERARERAAAAAEQVAARTARKLKQRSLDSLMGALATAPGFRIYTGVAPETTRRRDGFMFPLNTDYDLFSLGPDGRTAVSVGSLLGQDDVIRANNGAFFGPAREY
jgi:general secretion pathway protein G